MMVVSDGTNPGATARGGMLGVEVRGQETSDRDQCQQHAGEPQ